jgi:hypothetical protein
LVLLLSPSDRQSGELAAKVFGYYGALGQPISSRKRTELVVDEAGRVSDALYPAVRPMLAVSRGLRSSARSRRRFACAGRCDEWHVDLRKPKGGSDMGKAGLSWDDGG